jgi:hypothetical protein
LWDKDALRVQQKAHPNSTAVLGDDSRLKAREKIMTRQTAHGIIATLDTGQYYSPNSAHTTRLKDDCDLTVSYILGILNSRLMSFYYQNEFK